ncbi:unnamed protein product [Bursaphelenchus okinawaensis]|uniref:MGAT4 conserved region domain-containing protein n=1 Tax=Bursaphelenchus okinawaensis TaxID=465554 RepID=A0A811KHE0_9BILA|nr:unnamed protein product [Bursaphelenchus okinawaensis]CAG9104582.1 unnamed protein product [Bursaphelenchus okinawaensis]
MLRVKGTPRLCKLLLTSTKLVLVFVCIFSCVNYFTDVRNNKSIRPKEDHFVLINNNSVPAQYLNFFDLDNLDPIVYISAPENLHRSTPDIIVGIPTSPRYNGSYLFKCLDDLLDKMYDEEVHRVKFVVSCSYNNTNAYCNDLAEEIKIRYEWSISVGLLEFVSYPLSWTPLHFPEPLHNQLNLNDSSSRFYWRTKQQNDFIYLMSYCYTAYNSSKYYIQLEDDVITKKGFISHIERFIDKEADKPWVILEFSIYGFIGKLFKMKTLKEFILFDIPLYNILPVDWALDKFTFGDRCQDAPSRKTCIRKMYKTYRLNCRPALFQHIGYYSSLYGKIQKAKERVFLNKPLPVLIENQKPTLENATCTDLRVTKQMIEDMYYGEKPLNITGDINNFELKLMLNSYVFVEQIDFRYRYESKWETFPFQLFYNQRIEAPSNGSINVQINELTIRLHSEISNLVITRLSLRRPS